MALGLSNGFGLLPLLLFILPGLVGVKAGLRYADRADTLSRIDTLGLSLGLSVVALLITYGASSIVVGNLLTFSNVMDIVEILPLAIALYIMQFPVTTLLGWYLGSEEFYRGEPSRRDGLWPYFFNKVRKRSEEEDYAVKVYLTNGYELSGRVEEKGQIGQGRDMILQNPRRIQRDVEGNVVRNKIVTGPTYIHEQEITHVEFDRLPDADQIESQEGEVSEVDEESAEERLSDLEESHDDG